MQSYISLVLAALTFLLTASAVTHAQVTEDQARRVALASSCAGSLNSDGRLLKVVSDYAVEDALFSKQPKLRGSIRKGVYVFRLWSAGYFVLSPDEYISVTSDGSREAWIAVNSADGQVYGLYGCTGADLAFSRMIQALRVRINTDAEARDFSQLWFQVVRDPMRKLIVDDVRDLERFAVESYLCSSGFESFRRWQTNWKRTASKVTLGCGTKRLGGVFVVSRTYVDRPNGFPRLHQLEISIDSFGRTNLLSESVVIDSDRLGDIRLNKR